MKAWMPFLLLFAIHASPDAQGLDLPYHAAVEFRPLKTYGASFERAIGAEFGAELGVVAGNFLTIAGGRAFGSGVSDTDRAFDIVGENWSLGLRNYSYYRTDSLYLGAALVGSRIELQTPGGQTTWLTETYRQAQVESGFRWLWMSGVMVRTGIVIRNLVKGPDVRTHTADPHLGLMREESGRRLRQDLRFEVRRIEMALDLGLGLVF